MTDDQKTPETVEQDQIQPEDQQDNSESSAQQPKDPIQELTTLLKLTQANFENYRKQTEKRIEDIKQFASKDVLMQLLPILDNFKLALETIEKSSQHSEMLKGIELIYAQFDELLANNDVKIIPSENQKFDPYLHEALMKVPSDKKEGMIIEEFQRGYTLNGKVIRHARVKISAGKQ